MSRKKYNLAAVLMICLAGLPGAGGTAQAVQQFEIPAGEFLSDTFSGVIPEPAVLWLTGSLKAEVKQILGHDYASLRVRYWRQGSRFAWILSDIGKERPITAGFVISGDSMESGKVRARWGAEVALSRRW